MLHSRTNSLDSNSQLFSMEMAELLPDPTNVVDHTNGSMDDQQRMEKLEFLRDQSRKLDKLLQSMRGNRIPQIELLMLSTSSAMTTLTLEEKEIIDDLTNQIQSLKTQNLSLNYLVNTYDGKILPRKIGLIPTESSSQSLMSAGSLLLNSQSLSSTSHLVHENGQVFFNDVSNGEQFADNIYSQDTPDSGFIEPENQDLSPINLELTMIEFVSDDYLVWICPACTFKNHPAIDICEMCETRKRPPLSPTK